MFNVQRAIFQLYKNLNATGLETRYLAGGEGVWFIVSFTIFFSDNHELELFFFLLSNSTLGYMTKTLNQIIFFPPPNQNILFSNIGNQNIFFRKKNITPPTPFKLMVVPLQCIVLQTFL